MNIELDNTTLFALVIFMVVLYLMTAEQQNKEKWTLLGGAEQKWKNLKRDNNICDTDYDDENCKFSTSNCLENPNSALWKDY
jgi:hypothetical protein